MTWQATARRTIEGRRLVAVGIGTGLADAFAGSGGRVVGAVSILPAGHPPAPALPGRTLPVLHLAARTRHVLDVVVSDYAATLARYERTVATFLDAVDPGREATVASYLPLPFGVVDGRPVWASDATVARRLEDKRCVPSVLARAVPTVTGVDVDVADPIDERWWDDTCRRLGSATLVLQREGVSGGGTGTFVCRSAADALAVPAPGRAMPFVAGTPANVMGVVTARGDVLALPPSRQIVSPDGHGRPVYAGNVVGERWPSAELAAIAEETRALGTVLADEGFTGPFGADFIRDPDGRRWYHDLNPRMNGAVDSLALAVEGWDAPPLAAVLLCAAPWPPDEVEALAAEVATAARASPHARLFLSREVAASTVITEVPPGGTWEIEPTVPAVAFVGAGGGRDDVGGSRALLRPTLQPGLALQPGDRLVLGDLFCSLDLFSGLQRDHGERAPGAVLDALVP